MHLGSGPSENIEVDAEALETLIYYLVVFIYNILRAASLLAGGDGNGHAVLVGTADIQDFFSLHSEEPDINIGGHINSGQMSDMHWTVGIGQCTGYKGAFKTFFHTLSLSLSEYSANL